MDVELARLPLQQNLSLLSQHLWREHIPHRIFEVDNQQVLLLSSEQTLLSAQVVYAAWQRGDLPEISVLGSQSVSQSQSSSAMIDQLRRLFSQFPLTLILIAMSIAGFLLVSIDSAMEFVPWLSFQFFQRQGDYLLLESPLTALLRGELWRPITPIFLHFGILHVSFNMLWLWEFGRCIEQRQSSKILALLVLFIAIVSNCVQGYFSAGLFGGMSGVIYGLLAYCWLHNRLVPNSLACVNQSVFIMMLAWLLLCLSGLVTAAGFGAIANAAHVSGLLMGLFLAWITVLLGRKSV